LPELRGRRHRRPRRGQLLPGRGAPCVRLPQHGRWPGQPQGVRTLAARGATLVWSERRQRGPGQGAKRAWIGHPQPMSNEGMGRGGGVPAARELHHGLLGPMSLTTQGGEYPQTPAGPEAINLGLGQPSPSLLPLALIHGAAASRLGPDADPLVLQYGEIHGPASVREALARLLTRRYGLGPGQEVRPSQLLVTGGISSALSFT